MRMVDDMRMIFQAIPIFYPSEIPFFPFQINVRPFKTKISPHLCKINDESDGLNGHTIAQESPALIVLPLPIKLY